MVTAPLDILKSLVLKLAIPLLLPVASSPAIVMVFEDTVVSIPSPAAKVNVSPRATASLDPDYAATVIVGLAKLPLVIAADPLKLALTKPVIELPFAP